MSETAMVDYLNKFDAFIEKVRKEGTPEQAKEALIRTGVLEEDGKTISERHRWVEEVEK